MNIYTPDNIPARGKAKKIWDALIQNGFKVRRLHYNANCWGRGRELGWGTWTFSEDDLDLSGSWCGIHEGKVYVMMMEAPYSVAWI
jgi:hypothetical protein